MTDEDRNSTLQHMDKLLKHAQTLEKKPFVRANKLPIMECVDILISDLVEDFHNEKKINERNEEIEKILKDDETN